MAVRPIGVRAPDSTLTVALDHSEQPLRDWGEQHVVGMDGPLVAVAARVTAGRRDDIAAVTAHI